MSYNKMKYFHVLSLIITTMIVFSCGQGSNDNIEQLRNYMTGTFNSEEQSIQDTNYFNIHLNMVPIWENNADTVWLYVEQAASWSLEKPYRQRVYRLTYNNDGSIESAVFTFDKPLRFTGVWKEDKPLSELSPDSLMEREGCSLILKKMGNAFVGSTVDQNCSSELRGASYVTSEVRIEENVLTSWDRGFDSEGNQVWGAVQGPYIFKKIKSSN
jgi:hypothetical protein